MRPNRSWWSSPLRSLPGWCSISAASPGVPAYSPRPRWGRSTAAASTPGPTRASCSSPSMPGSGRVPGAMGLEDYQQVRDEVWDQIVQSSVLDAEYRRRGISVSDERWCRPSGFATPRIPQRSRVSNRQPVRSRQVPALADLQRGPAVSPQSGGPVPGRAAAASFCASSPPISTSPTPPCGSTIGTNTRWSRSV